MSDSIRKAKILLVEDNPTDEELAMLALRRNVDEEDIFVVRDGAEALDYLFCEGKYSRRTFEMLPRVVLLDLKLPKVSGKEVLRQIKQDERTRHVPVVILSSSDLSEDIQSCYELGSNSYTTKPVEFLAFSEKLSNIQNYWTNLNRSL